MAMSFGEQVKNSSVKAPFKIKLCQGYIYSQLYDIYKLLTLQIIDDGGYLSVKNLNISDQKNQTLIFPTQ